MYPSCTKSFQYLTAPERTNNLLWRYGHRLICRGSVTATSLKHFGPHAQVSCSYKSDELTDESVLPDHNVKKDVLRAVSCTLGI